MKMTWWSKRELKREYKIYYVEALVFVEMMNDDKKKKMFISFNQINRVYIKEEKKNEKELKLKIIMNTSDDDFHYALAR